MDNTSKMTIVAKDGTALIGNHFHTLVDESKLSFLTDDIASFKDFVKSMQSDLSIFYYDGSVVAMPKIVNVNTQSIATCLLKETSYVKHLKILNGKEGILGEIEKTMRLFRPFSGASGKQILDFCKSAHIEDVVNIDREKSNTGEYTFSMTRKKSGRDKWTCPESVTFSIPVFKNIPDVIELTFETAFDYEAVGDKVKMVFTFSNIDLDNILDFSKKQIITEYFKEFTCPKYWGTATVMVLNDAWKYRKNPLSNG